MIQGGLAGLFLVVVLLTAYSDFKAHKIYNKILLPAILCALVLHSLAGHFFAFLFATLMAFSLFFLVYVFGLTSPGDVKLFAVLGGITGSVPVVQKAFVFCALIQFGIALYALIKACMRHKMSPLQAIKADILGYFTKTGSVIQPIRFPAAALIGLSFCISEGLNYTALI